MADDLLLTTDQIQAGLNETLPVDTLDIVAKQLSDAVRDYCGWRIAPAMDEEFKLTARGREVIFIPSLHINSITSITDHGTPLVVDYDYDWEPYGLIERTNGQCWGKGRRGVVVNVNHGFDECPGSIAGVLRDAVSRAELSPSGGIVSLTLPTSGTVFSRASAGGPAAGSILLPHELAVLDRYHITQTH